MQTRINTGFCGLPGGRCANNMIRKLGRKIKDKICYGIQVLEDNSGMSVIELLLILVVIIALILIFKNQLTDLVNTIFEKITSESAGI